MKSAILCLAATLLLVGCKTDVANSGNHWRLSSVPERWNHHFLNGYNAHEDGSWRQFQWEQKQDINRTLQRHLLSINYDNPFQPADPRYPHERTSHSILPYPWEYIHIEGLLWGAVLLNPAGSFLILPVGSILGTLEPGGPTEFIDGISSTFEHLGVLVATFVPGGVDEEAETMRASWVPIEVR